jgi:hypothetical protein
MVREDNEPDLPATHFKYTINGVVFPNPPLLPIAPSVILPFTGLTVAYGPELYKQGSTYSWRSLAPITLGPAAFDRFNVRNFGAVPNWDGATASNDGTANLVAFEAALAAMAADDNKSAILVADGHFFLSGTLHIRQTIVFEGTGRNESTVGGVRSSPGTWLVFPRDCDGLRLHSSKDGLGGGAEFAVLRNLTIYCKELRPSPFPPGTQIAACPPLPGQTGHGVHANCFFRAENVSIHNFGEHEIFISAGSPPAEPGNATGFLLDSCVIGKCPNSRGCKPKLGLQPQIRKHATKTKSLLVTATKIKNCLG